MCKPLYPWSWEDKNKSTTIPLLGSLHFPWSGRYNKLHKKQIQNDCKIKQSKLKCKRVLITRGMGDQERLHVKGYVKANGLGETGHKRKRWGSNLPEEREGGGH